MIRATDEKKSNGPLIAFIDLLFLLVAFFTLLLFFIQERQQASEEELEAVENTLSRIVGEEVDVREAVSRLEPMLERFQEQQAREAERERRLAEREARRRERTTVRLEYRINADGTVGYEGRRYSLGAFKREVVDPLRAEHWVAFRAYADPETAFGEVVRSRRILLKGSNEFDTYWDNVTRNQTSAGEGD